MFGRWVILNMTSESYFLKFADFIAWNSAVHVAERKSGLAAIEGFIPGIYLFLLCIFRWNGWKMKTSSILLKIGILYYYWSQPHHQAGPPLRYCQLYLCCQKHCRQEEKHNRNCHSLWWVNFVCLNLVQVKLQPLILVLEYQVKRALLSPHCSSLPASHMDSEVSLLFWYS